MLDFVIRDTAWMTVRRDLCVWLAMGFAGAVLTPAAVEESAVVAALGAIARVLGRPALALVSLACAGVLSPDLFPWALAAAALTRSSRAHFPAPGLDSEPQRQLMRSRRRNETAAVLVMRTGPLSQPMLGELLAGLRVTDGFEMVTMAGVTEMRAVLEGEEVDKEAIERRMRTAAGPAHLRFGWARFPVDGVTLDVLLEHARTALETHEAVTEQERRTASSVAVPAPSIADAR
jgi:hypothetical protein